MYKCEQQYGTYNITFYTSQMSMYERIVFDKLTEDMSYKIEQGKIILNLFPDEVEDLIYNLSLKTAKPICYTVFVPDDGESEVTEHE